MNPNSDAPMKSRFKNAVVLLSGLIVTVGLAFSYVYLIEPALIEKKASQELSEAFEKRAPLTASNTETSNFSSDLGESKALAENSTVTNPAGFKFTNEKRIAEREFSAYLDFSSQRSRDFIVLNSVTLKNLIESGSVNLTIHAVPTESPFSIYAGQALSLSFSESPEKAWPLLIELMKISAEIDASEDEWSNDQLRERIASAAKDLGAESITAEALKSGSYVNWLMTVADDSRVNNQYGLPALYIDGSLVDQESIDVNHAPSLTKLLRG